MATVLILTGLALALVMIHHPELLLGLIGLGIYLTYFH